MTCHTQHLAHLEIMSALYLSFLGGGWGHITLQSFGDIYNLKRIIFMCSRGNNEVSNEGNAMRNKTLPQRNVNSLLKGMNEVFVSAKYDFQSHNGS